MPHSLSNQLLWITNATSAICTPAVRELYASLTEKYGLAAHDLDAMDEPGLIRTAATLDFLANNLPQETSAQAASTATADQ